MNHPTARNREKSIGRRGWLASIGNEAREHVFADTHVKNCDNVQRQGKGRVRKRQDISSNIHDDAYTSSSVRSMVTRRARVCTQVSLWFFAVYRVVSCIDASSSAFTWRSSSETSFVRRAHAHVQYVCTRVSRVFSFSLFFSPSRFLPLPFRIFLPIRRRIFFYLWIFLHDRSTRVLSACFVSA